MESIPSRRGLSGTALKRIACISMLIDHIGASCLEAGAFSTAPAISSHLLRLDFLLRCIGRLAFPIYCFLLVEGFVHTRNPRRYAGRMLLFGLVSEVPFDLAFFRTPVYWGHQNVYWTLFLGLAALICLSHTQADGRPSAAGTLGALSCAVLAELCRTDYGAIGVATIAVLYLLRENRKSQCLVGAALCCYELPAPAAYLPVWFYNGKRGHCGRVQQWGFYLFYPVHLALLACITNWML